MEKEEKKELALIIVSGVLLAAAAAVKLFVPQANGAVVLVCFLVPYLVAGYSVLYSSIKNILHGEVFDENFLMSAATIGALCLGKYAEAVAVMLFYRVGELFEDIAVEKSRRSITDLMNIRPDTANLIKDGAVVTVDPKDVNIGELIVVKAGEKLPLDGVVVDGCSTVNTAALTGESAPRDVTVGDSAVSGCVNGSGTLTVRVTKRYEDSTVSQILELVENASAKKAKAENFITKFSAVYTPAVVGAAVLLAVLPPLLLHESFSEWISRGLTFLVISCPCALVISVPLSFFVGIGKASRCGVLIKGSKYIDVLSKVSTVVFDKTGTLTRGNFQVTAVHPEKISEKELLHLATAAESMSNHPVSLSLKAAAASDFTDRVVESSEELTGMGVVSVIDGKSVAVGNGRLMQHAGADWHDCHHVGTIVHVAVDGEYMGHIVISDEMKEGSPDAIAALSKTKRLVMLTGDRKEVALDTADKLGIKDVFYELLPDGKAQKVEQVMAEDGKTLAFVGDGINDAPVLMLSDVGIAMGALGADAAIEAADVVLMDDDPRKIPYAFEVAAATIAKVRQNIIFILIVKALVLILGALGFAGMWMAVFADVGVSVIAILNSISLRRKLTQ